MVLAAAEQILKLGWLARRRVPVAFAAILVTAVAAVLAIRSRYDVGRYLAPLDAPGSDRQRRTIYNCILNSTRPAPGSTDRLFSTFDLTPTIMEAMGLQWYSRRFGLGVSLFSGEPTLLEKIGVSAYERQSSQKSRKLNYLILGRE